jgi:glycosyltransferase involved in cell wall biosynthesis
MTVRVLLVAPNAPPSMGGVELHVMEIARRLPGHGITASILTVDADGDLPTEEVIDGVHIERVRGWPTGRDWRFAPGLIGRIRSAGADVVHLHSYQTFVAPLTLATARACRIPTVVTFHSGGHSSGWRRAIRPAQVLGLSPLLRGADALVAVSPFEASVFARRLRVRETSIEVIRNGADLPDPAPHVTPEPGLLLSIGRLEAYKGHRRAVAALAERARTDPDARLVILGTGPDEAALRTVAADLGVGDRVSVTSVPPGDRQRYADLLQRAQVVMILSGYESQGIAAWEAAGLRRPLVVTEATALAELVALGLATGVGPDDDARRIAVALDAAIAQAGRAAPEAPAVATPTWADAAARLASLYPRVAGAGPVSVTPSSP